MLVIAMTVSWSGEVGAGRAVPMDEDKLPGKLALASGCR